MRDRRDEDDERSATWLHRGLFVLALVVLFGARVSLVAGTLPYPLHEDEGHIARAAARMIRDGEANPRFFRYPSLPIYVATGSFLVGRAIDGDTAAPVGRVQRPFYARPTVVATARVAFVLLSVMATAFAAAAAARAFAEPAILWSAPLVLALSDRFLLQSWSYLNVDIVGAAVCTGAVWLAIARRERTSLFQRALLPGLVTGLAVGSKYYLGVVGLPFALLLFAREPGDSGEQREQRPAWKRNVPAIVLATLAGFVLSTPYSVLDSKAFTTGVVTEVGHYAEGHDGGEGEPGLSQLAYYGGEIVDEFGAGSVALAFVGVAFAFARRRRELGLYVAFPLLLLAFLCTQRVHFPRNLTSFYALLPGLVAFGVISLARLLAAPFANRNALAVPSTAVLVVALAAPFVPWQRALAKHTAPPDSRNRAATWIAENLSSDGAESARRVWIAEELQMDLRAVRAAAPGFDVVEAPIVEFVVPGMRKRHAASNPVFVLPTAEDGTRFASTYGDLLAPTRQLEELARFGTNGVPRIRSRLVHMGNPRLAIHVLPGAVSAAGAALDPAGE